MSIQIHRRFYGRKISFCMVHSQRRKNLYSIFPEVNDER